MVIQFVDGLYIVAGVMFILSLAGLSRQTTPAPSSANARLYYYTTPRSTLEAEVHTVPPTDQARFDRLKALFNDAGCSGDQLKTEPATRKQNAPANLICTWPGNSAAGVVVVAEYLHEGKGQGAIENWSGAALLPRLYLAMQARPRENNWVFVESAGRAGDIAWIHSLTGKQKKQIRAMVALTSLGVTPVLRYYSPHPEEVYLPAPLARLQMTLALTTLSDMRVPRPELVNPWRWLPFDDTEPFRYSHVPSIILHSIADNDSGLPGSVHDTAAAINGNDYFMNYRAVAVFLVGLDSLAAKLQKDDRIWHGEGGQFHLDPNDLPVLR